MKVLDKETKDIIELVDVKEFDEEKHEPIPKWVFDRPAAARKIFSRGSRAEAVKLNCIECSGGSILEAKRCIVYECPMWKFRPGAERGITPPGIPNPSAIDSLCSEDGRASRSSVHLQDARAKRRSEGGPGSSPKKTKKKTKRVRL